MDTETQAIKGKSCIHPQAGKKNKDTKETSLYH